MIVRDPNPPHDFIGIRCNGVGCETVAPPAEEIMKGHGLNNMGWHCFGGTHYCPTCTERAKAARS